MWHRQQKYKYLRQFQIFSSGLNAEWQKHHNLKGINIYLNFQVNLNEPIHELWTRGH